MRLFIQHVDRDCWFLFHPSEKILVLKFSAYSGMQRTVKSFWTFLGEYCEIDVGDNIQSKEIVATLSPISIKTLNTLEDIKPFSNFKSQRFGKIL